MPDTVTLDYIIQSQAELNYSYIPFIIGGGLFIPTPQLFSLGDTVLINLQLPNQLNKLTVEGKVVWIIPKNALYQVYSGIGIQVIGANAKEIRDEIKANLDNKMELGGYIFGLLKEA